MISKNMYNESDFFRLKTQRRQAVRPRAENPFGIHPLGFFILKETQSLCSVRAEGLCPEGLMALGFTI